MLGCIHRIGFTTYKFGKKPSDLDSYDCVGSRSSRVLSFKVVLQRVKTYKDVSESILFWINMSLSHMAGSCLVFGRSFGKAHFVLCLTRTFLAAWVNQVQLESFACADVCEPCRVALSIHTFQELVRLTMREVLTTDTVKWEPNKLN